MKNGRLIPGKVYLYGPKKNPYKVRVLRVGTKLISDRGGEEQFQPYDPGVLYEYWDAPFPPGTNTALLSSFQALIKGCAR